VLSHDLARALLARRNNDVLIEVLVDEDPTGERELQTQRVDLRDGGQATGSMWQVPSDLVVEYDGADDVVVIRAGFVVLGGPPT
jgi:hypothetical protein